MNNHAKTAINKLPRRENKLVSLIGENDFVKAVRSMRNIRNFRTGSLVLMLLSGSLTYYFYRSHYSNLMTVSHAVYRFTKDRTIDLNAQVYIDAFGEVNNRLKRMTEKQYQNIYNYRLTKVTGYFDHNKEIHIPRTLNGEEGYDIITPFYYYNIDNVKNEGLKGATSAVPEEQSLRGGIAVRRGW